MNREGKQSRCIIFFLVLLYIVFVVCLFLFQPFVACAKETDTTETTDTLKKNVPGGKGNKVHIRGMYWTDLNPDVKYLTDRTLIANEDVEVVGYIKDYGDPVFRQDLYWAVVKNGEIQYGGSSTGYLSDFVGVSITYEKGQVVSSSSYTNKNILEGFIYYYLTPDGSMYIDECIVTGMKIFKDRDSLEAYVDNGSLDGMIKDEIDKSWYLKDIRCKYNLNGSPSPEADSELATIDFTWLTDNLQDGDLLEIKTHNYVTKLNGDKISGYLNYITWRDNVSSYVGKYSMPRYGASNEWLNTLENKPLLPKDFDTDIYYFRPYRNGVYGLWCKCTMGRRANGIPYIKDIEIGDIDDDGGWDRDDDATEENGGNHGIDEDGNDIDPDNPGSFNDISITGIFKAFYDFMKSLPSLLGDLPELVKTTIGFLPDWVIGFIGIAIVVVILLRVVGR